MQRLWAAVAYGWACIFVLSAQQSDPPPAETRAGQIESGRAIKAHTLEPEEPLKGERIVKRIIDNPFVKTITNEQSGFGLKLGGLITGSGMAAGPQYARHDLAKDTITFRAWASISTSKFWLARAELNMPHLAGNWLFAEFSATHRDFPSIDYFGPGAHSDPRTETTFSIRDNWLAGRAGVHFLSKFRLGGIGRFLDENAGPGGGDDSSQAIYNVFPAGATPGIGMKTRFAQAGSFLEFDYRDSPGEAHRGGYYQIRYSDYSDLSHDRFSFDRVDADVQQYIPFFNDTHVIALHGRATFTDPHSGNAVPFYMQPYLGGPDTLRGFEPFRFFDNNTLVLNGEYRWRVYQGMDAALFVDAGQVFRQWEKINLRAPRTSYGFGMRFLSASAVFLRLDVGFSQEGFQIWFKFGNVFGTANEIY
ncbi:MAG: BamA/TamA family outer membrane protein [Bryobacteraceae bacterium]